MESATAGGVGNPVEDEREEEKGDDVQELVIGLELGGHIGVGAVRQQSDVGRENEEEDEGAWTRGSWLAEMRSNRSD